MNSVLSLVLLREALLICVYLRLSAAHICFSEKQNWPQMNAD
jgi:hypothetical protein